MDEATMIETARLRDGLVDAVLKYSELSPVVEQTMRAVPRHVFVPDASLVEAYADDTVVTRRDGDGIATSSASAPWLVGVMLDQLQVAPGMRVLEIGGGTGYNAALLAELVGEQGHVTTVEITPDVAEDARAALADAEVPNVEVVCGDGANGHEANAPFDRIIATAGVWEVPQAWADQLAPSGILVVPLRMRGVTRAVAFGRDGQVWRSISAHVCGFMPMHGDDAMVERNIRVAEDVTARFDDGTAVDPRAVEQAAAGPGVVEWSGIGIDAPLDLLDFYLADLDGFCRVLAPPSIASRGLAAPVNGWGSMGVATAGALGYLTTRTSPDNPYLSELGICAYGPDAAATVAAMAERVRRWDRDRHTVTGVRIDVYPAGHGDTVNALLTVDKRHSRIVVTPAEAQDS